MALFLCRPSNGQNGVHRFEATGLFEKWGSERTITATHKIPQDVLAHIPPIITEDLHEVKKNMREELAAKTKNKQTKNLLENEQ